MTQPEEQHWSTWDYVLLFGEKKPRIRYRPKQKQPKSCPECQTSAGGLHEWGCINEYCPCTKHEFFVECDCPWDLGESGAV